MCVPGPRSQVLPLKVFSLFTWPVVYSKELQWLANGSEWPPDATKKFTAFSSNQSGLKGMAEAPPQSHYDDIVLAKLRPGQVGQGGGCHYVLMSSCRTLEHGVIPALLQ